jgi:hypothetical protein
VNTAAHAPPSFPFAAGFFATGFFATAAFFTVFVADFFAVPVAFFPPVRLPFPADAISCLVILILVALICFKGGQTLNASRV